MRLLVKQVRYEASGINSYMVVDPAGAELPPFTAGAHLDMFFRDGRVRQYSICSDPTDRKRYKFAVLRVPPPTGRGGSQAVFDRVHVGRTIALGEPRNMFPLDEEAERHLLIAGGIGITPIMAMLTRLQAIGADFKVVYCTRSPEYTAFMDELSPLAEDGRVVYHHDGGNLDKALDIEALLREYQQGTHLYYCGPAGMMSAVQKASAHWPEGSVHHEYFAGPALPPPAPPGTAHAEDAVGVGFQVKVASTGAVYDVPNDKSIVKVLEENGVSVSISCNSGLCATCKTRYLEGEPDHKDFILSRDEQESVLTPCVSRAKSAMLVLDL